MDNLRLLDSLHVIREYNRGIRLFDLARDQIRRLAADDYTKYRISSAEHRRAVKLTQFKAEGLRAGKAAHARFRSKRPNSRSRRKLGQVIPFPKV